MPFAVFWSTFSHVVCIVVVVKVGASKHMALHLHFVLFWFRVMMMHCVFRPSATVSRIGLMESRLHCCRGGPPLPPLVGWLTPPRDGWLGRWAFALTKRTCSLQPNVPPQEPVAAPPPPPPAAALPTPALGAGSGTYPGASFIHQMASQGVWFRPNPLL